MVIHSLSSIKKFNIITELKIYKSYDEYLGNI